MRQLYSFLLLSLLCFSAYGQRDTLYLSSTLGKVPAKRMAAFYRLTTFSGPDNSRKHVTTYHLTGEKHSEEISLAGNDAKRRQKESWRTWYKNGQVQEEKLFKDNTVKVTKWHENGQVYYSFVEVDGKKEGEALGYYPNGKLRRSESFAKGELLAGKCFSEAGEIIPYYPHYSAPAYPSGTDELIKLVSRNFRIPVEAMRKNVSGVMVFKILISATGKVKGIEMVKSLLPALDLAAADAVKSLSAFHPATIEGEPIDDVLTMPMNIRYLNSSEAGNIKKR